jgi:two-component system, NarL family, sensor kinase
MGAINPPDILTRPQIGAPNDRLKLSGKLQQPADRAQSGGDRKTLLLNQNLADGQVASDWTIDPHAFARGKKVTKGKKGKQPTYRPATPAPAHGAFAVPVDRRTSGISGDRRRSAAVAVPTLRASEALRPFFGVSFVAIVIAAMLLMLCYRYFTIQAVTEQTGQTNAVAADAAAASNHEQIADFLAKRSTQPDLPFPAEIAAPLLELVKDTPVQRVRIINAQHQVVFSTGPDASIDSPLEDEVVSNALLGKQVSKLNYRDLFNSFAFAPSTEKDNMVVTGLPLQQEHQGPYLGVFEIQTDVGHLVAHHEQAQLLIAGTASLVMLVLYGSLLTTIRRIGRVIDIQQDALRERSNLLAELSTGMMNVQEEEKQRIAVELHERVAQTLAAIKFNIESATVNVRQSDVQAASMLQSLLAPVHDAIQEVRAAASRLRPASLDDLGLLPTLKGLWRKLADQRPDLSCDHQLLVEEQDIPSTLRPIIFRAAEDACNAVVANLATRRAAFRLELCDGSVVLAVRCDATPDRPDADQDHPFARIRERALLSGGTFSCRANSWGGLSVKASWPTGADNAGQ